MSKRSKDKIVFGGAAFGYHFDAVASKDILAALKKHGIDTIDTAQIYSTSEEILGELKAGEHFTIDTKAA